MCIRDRLWLLWLLRLLCRLWLLGLLRSLCLRRLLDLPRLLRLRHCVAQQAWGQDDEREAEHSHHGASHRNLLSIGEDM